MTAKASEGRFEGYFPVYFPHIPQVRAIQTLRSGGVSVAPWASQNLGTHVGDDAGHVQQNRQQLLVQADLPAEPQWLEQVHGVDVVEVDADLSPTTVPIADAVFTQQRNRPIAVMTADCLPILLADHAGTVVAAIHAGWRSLCAGVIQACLARLAQLPNIPVLPADLSVWLGPAIGPEQFEVGAEVRQQFLARAASHEAEQVSAAFVARQDSVEEKWLADIRQLACIQLDTLGVPQANIQQCQDCTVSDSDRYFSYRRDGQTGRMASIIWLALETT